MTTPTEIVTPSPPPSLVSEPPISAASIEESTGTNGPVNYETESMLSSSSHYNPYSARQEKEGERPVWSSRYAYTCGALLSLPLSQLWRGAALLSGSTSVFASLIGLMLAICVIGMPLYVLELGWGQKYQVGAVGIWHLPHFGKRKRRWTGLGVCGTVLGLVYACYTMGILGWTLHALVDTFTLTPEDDNNPWTTSLSLSSPINSSDNDAKTPRSYAFTFTNRQQAVEAYWVEDVVGQATLMVDGDSAGLPTRFLIDNLVYIAILWGILGAISSLGIRLLGRITLVTTSVSLLLLLALFAASLMVSNDNNNEEQESSSAWADFANSIDQDDVLSESIVQTLYLTCLVIGIQSAYASYGPVGQAAEPIAKIGCLVMAINTLLIFATGFVISTAIPSDIPYYQMTNTAWNSSLRLVFAYWPAALSTLSGGLVWVRLLYSVLILLGIQLPLAVLAAILTVLLDDRASTLARWKVAGLATVVGFGATIVFATDAGLIWLDAIDYYLTLTLLLVGFLEAFAAGWMYDLEDQVRTYGILPVIFSILWNFSPVVVAAGVWFGLGNNAEAADHYHHMWLGLFGALIAFLLFFMLAFVSIRRSYEHYVARCESAASSNERILHPRDYYLDFSFGNVETLKQNLESSMGANLPQIWYIFLKRVVPHLLLLVFLKRLLMVVAVPVAGTNNQYTTAMAFGSYGGYPMLPYQVTGMTIFGLVVALFVLGLVCPHVYTPLVPPPTSVFINRRDTMEDEEDIEDPTGHESESEVNLDELPNMEDPVEVMGGRSYVVDIQ